MSKTDTLDALLALPPLLTAVGVRDLIGQLRLPCSKCGSPHFSVTARGEWLCWGCQWERSQQPTGIVLRAIILTVNGHPAVHDLAAIDQAEERERKFKMWTLDRFEHDGHEWVAWESPEWRYMAATYDLPLQDILDWVDRTRKPGFNPDEGDFQINSQIPSDMNMVIYKTWRPK